VGAPRSISRIKLSPEKWVNDDPYAAELGRLINSGTQRGWYKQMHDQDCTTPEPLLTS
jgi:hypothetical protein